MTAAIPMQAASIQPALADAAMVAGRLAATAAVLPHFDLLSMYSNALRDAPLETKAITAGVLACAGDAFAQGLSTVSSPNENAEPFEYDFRRGLAFAAFGASYTGAFQHFWFNWLNDHLVGSTVSVVNLLHLPDMLESVGDATGADLVWPQPSPEILAFGKVGLNQFGVVPVLYMPLFFAVTGALAGLSLDAALERMRTLYVPILRRNYAFWLPTQFMVFFALPQEYQVPFLSAASLVWTIILSTLGSGKLATAIDESEVPAELFGVSCVAEIGEIGVTIDELTDGVTLEDVTSAAGAFGAQGGLVAAGFAIASAAGIDGGEIAVDAIGSAIGSATKMGIIQEVLLDTQAIPLALALGGASDIVANAAEEIAAEFGNEDDGKGEEGV